VELAYFRRRWRKGEGGQCVCRARINAELSFDLPDAPSALRCV
jgi:hypothetical protein